MKRIIVMVMAMMAVTAGFAQTVNDVFNAFKGNPKVCVLQFPKSVLKMAMQMEESKEISMMKDFVDKVDNMSVMALADGGKETMAQIEKELGKLDKDIYEDVLNMNDGEDNIQVMKRGEGNKVDELVIYFREKENVAVMQVQGTMTTDDIAKLVEKIGEMKKDKK